MEKVCIVTGLPRAGSTLFCNVLAQNPDFNVGGTSPLVELMHSIREAAYKSSSYRADVSQQQPLRLKNALRGLMSGWLSGRRIGVDKNRAWMAYSDLLAELYPEAYMIVLLRDLRGVMSSMEKRRRANPIEADPLEIEDVDQASTIEGRVRMWAQGAIVGVPTRNLMELLKSPTKMDRCFFLRMEDFCNGTDQALREIYDYLGEPWTGCHDLSYVEQRTHEHDPVYGMRGLHEIRSAVGVVKTDWEEVLGADVCSMIVRDNVWFYRAFYPEVLQTQA